MSKLLDDHLDILKPEYCFIISPSNPIEVSEKNPEGKGTCTFLSKDKVLMMRAKDKNSGVWALKNQKCAESSFLQIKEDGTKVLHLIEMKSGCSISVFSNACKQLEGMYFSSLAVMAALRLGMPDKVISYIAYTKESISNRVTLPTIANKPLVGKSEAISPEVIFWKNKYINSTHLKSKLVLGRRVNGNYDFGLIDF